MSIEVKGLTHIYNEGLPHESVALEGVTFSAQDGQLVGIIGHTGSGKSTLVQHLNGLLKPKSGSIVVGGTDITSDGVVMRDIRKKIGLVFQYPEYQLFEETVAKDVAFGPANLGLSEAEIDECVKEAIEMVGLDYEKVKNAGSRIHASERFAAVIFGNCPHKVAGMGNYSNIIDEFKSRANCPIAVDARNEAGGLKITKQSFKKALADICRQLKIQKVA